MFQLLWSLRKMGCYMLHTPFLVDVMIRCVDFQACTADGVLGLYMMRI